MKLTSLQVTKIPFTKEEVLRAKKDFGIYIFWDQYALPLYVGKSINLRNRLDSYLANDLETKTKKMVSLARYFSTIPVTSEIEALLLEAELVKENQPKYNIELKDDKSPLYIKITKEEFPRIITARKADIEMKDTSVYFGPFPSSKTVKMILKSLRRVFPYAQHAPSKRPCLYAQLNLCKPCPSYIVTVESPELRATLTREYRKNVSYVKMILSGKMKILRKTLEKKMHEYSKNEAFEEARKVREFLEKFDYITQPVNPAHYFMTNPNLVLDIRAKEIEELTILLKPYLHLPRTISRIECYDIAHISGSYPTASMVTFTDGEADKTFYRHFKIAKEKGGDDYASLREVAQRRKKHFDTEGANTDWGKPDLIIVDGGKGQLSTFLDVLGECDIPIVGLAKRFETLIIREEVHGIEHFRPIRVPEGGAKNLVQRIRNEAHRFARRLHHKLISKSITEA